MNEKNHILKTKQSATIEIIIDRATSYQPIPQDAQLQAWAEACIIAHQKSAVLSIRLVDEVESESLNKQYRQKEGPTNILSFEFDPPPGVSSDILGDIVLCPALIETEIVTPALREAHWAHLTIHGCLHLLGYQHDTEISAHQMEQLEIKYLAALGYPNPYHELSLS